MSLAVQSYPELFTLVLGWQQYEAIWQLWVALGLPFVPLLGLVMKTLTHSLSSAAPLDGERLLRTLEVQFFSLLLVITLAAQPLVLLKTHQITYTPQCGSQATVTPGQSGTTYDDVFTLPTQVKIPVWWYAVLSVSQGINSALKTALGCHPNVREMMMGVDEAKITDPHLRQEANWFYRHCFLAARAKLARWQRTLSHPQFEQRFGRALREFGSHDPQWVGSQFFLQTPGFYDVLQAKQPIAGFPVDPQRDWIWQQQNHPLAHGAPYCDAWWQDPQHGLKTRLEQVLPNTWYARFRSLLSDQDHTQLLQQLFQKAHSVEAHDVPRETSWLNRYYTWLGTAMHNVFSSYPKLHAVQQALIIARPLLMMILILCLPFIMWLTAYRIQSVVSASFLFCSMVWWDYLLHVIAWIDHALIQALYPNLLDQVSTQAMITNLLINTLTLGVVMGWFLVMSSVGVAAGHAMQSWLTNTTREAEKSGEAAGNTFKTNVSQLMNSRR